MTNKQLSNFNWACGLFEGEGCIHYHIESTRKYKRRRMTLSMTDLEPLEKFWNSIGQRGKIYGPYNRKNKPNNKPFWIWSCTNWTELEQLVIDMRPYLSSRRQIKIDELLNDPPLKRGTWKTTKGAESIS